MLRIVHELRYLKYILGIFHRMAFLNHMEEAK